jgi:hypothetical protein
LPEQQLKGIDQKEFFGWATDIPEIGEFKNFEELVMHFCLLLGWKFELSH